MLAVSINEACRITGIGRSTMYGLIAEGRLPLAKIGRKSVIRTPGDCLHDRRIPGRYGRA